MPNGDVLIAEATQIPGPVRSMCFLVDLTYWGMADYHHQWRQGISRLLQGAPSTALMAKARDCPVTTSLLQRAVLLVRVPHPSGAKGQWPCIPQECDA